jgi:hypothetical protein
LTVQTRCLVPHLPPEYFCLFALHSTTSRNPLYKGFLPENVLRVAVVWFGYTFSRGGDTPTKEPVHCSVQPRATTENVYPKNRKKCAGSSNFWVLPPRYNLVDVHYESNDEHKLLSHISTQWQLSCLARTLLSGIKRYNFCDAPYFEIQSVRAHFSFRATRRLKRSQNYT